MATVLSLRAANGREYSVAGVLRIGRAPDNEICLTGDDLVSRLHAQVWPDGERLFIRDEGSSNGTHVNGTTLNRGETYRLRPGDTVRVGGTIFTVVAGLAERVATGPVPVLTGAPPPLPPVTQRAAPPAPVMPPTAPAPPAATRIESSPIQPAASHRSRNVLVGGCLALIVLALCGGLVVLGATAGRPALATALAQAGGAPTPVPGSATVTPGPTSANPATPAPTSPIAAASLVVLPTRPATPALVPAAYAANSVAVAAALAELNAAQLQFIQHTPAGGPPNPAANDELLNIAAAAYKLGDGAESLCRASAVQAGASDSAGQVASLYAGLAQYGYAQALDAQNLRASLAAGQLDLAAAVALVADYGARAWNPSVTDPAKDGNPFLPFVTAAGDRPTAAPLNEAGAAALQTSLGGQATFQSWIAAPAQSVTRTVAFPRPTRPLDDPQDPAVLASLITPAGQADGDRASQAAAAGLQRLGATLDAAGSHGAIKGADLAAQSGTTPVRFQAPAALVMTGDAQPSGHSLPSFPGGSGAALAKNPPPAAGGGGDAFTSNVFTLGPDNTPAQTGDIPITQAALLVNLTITNIRVSAIANQTGFTEAKVQLAFDVSWQSNIKAPNFPISCSSQLAGQATAASGSLHTQVSYNLILYPGNAYVSCVAGDSGRYLGSAEASVLVGDAAEATQRVNKVETQYAASGETQAAVIAAFTTTAERHVTETQAVLQTQNALETEQAATQTAEHLATVTQAAAQTATAQAAGAFTLNGTFNLVQTDSGCTFADAPHTSGTFQMTVDFNAGTAAGTMSGGGGGTRSLRCQDDTGDMHWQQTYTVSFAGTIDKASGALTLPGKLEGSNNVTWTNCAHQGDTSACPADYARGYSFDVTLSGTVNKAQGTGSGTWVVTAIGLPTSGDWSAGK